MLIRGIIFGLLAATVQSLSYLFSRRFVTKPGNSSRLLFGLSHTWMGLFALALLPFCYSRKVADVDEYGPALAGAAMFYILGQLLLFAAIRRTPASRVSPLLGLKILILALVSVFLLRHPVTGLQWAAVGLSVAAAFILNYSGAAMPPAAFAVVLGTCLFYSLSDLNIVELTTFLAPEGGFRGILLGCSLSYMVCGAVGLGAVACERPDDRRLENWINALPVAVTWIVAMIFIFVCFRSVGAVFGNILQATRGPISILMGALIARVGMLHLEHRVGGRVLLRRIVAGVLMIVAVGVYARERARLQAPPPRDEQASIPARNLIEVKPSAGVENRVPQREEKRDD